MEDVAFAPTPIQKPRIPIWLAGVWPFDASLKLAARWDGLISEKREPSGGIAEITPDDVRAIRAWISEHRTATTPFDITFESRTPANDSEAASAAAQPYADAGVTWWLESFWIAPNDPTTIRERIRPGPPRVVA